MKTKLIILGLAALGFAGCQQFQKGEGGMLYKVHKDADGPNMKEGDFVMLKAIQKTESDSVIYSSYDYDQSSFLAIQKPMFNGDMFTALGMLSEGDSATVKVSLDSLVAKGMPKPTNGKDKFMVYVFKIEKVIPKAKLSDSAFNAQVQAFLIKERERAMAAEGGKIERYISSKGLKMETTASGLKYVVTKPGSGEKGVAGDTIAVNYTGTLISGKMFDTSIESVAKEHKDIYNSMRPYVPLKAALGSGGVMPGFEEALTLFPKGTKATVIIPSKIGYGEQGSGQIPPFSPLVFDLEFVDVIKPKAATAAATLPPPPPAAK